MLKRKFGKTSDLLPVVSQSQKCKREKRGQGEHNASLALSSVTLLIVSVIEKRDRREAPRETGDESG